MHNAEKMKTERIIGIIWLICGVLYLFQGLNYLYKYSTPNALWFVMIPIVLTYTKIICGILCLKIGTEFFKRKSENHYLILPLTFLLILYLTIDLIKYGTSTIYYSGENLLLLILIALSIYKMKSKIGITKLTEKLKKNKIKIIGILLLGFLPYLLAELTYYELYSFLH